MSFPSGRFVWFEYVAGDLARAQAFFGEVFAWKTQTMPMAGGAGAYTMIAAGEHMLGGYLETPTGAPPHAHWLAHLQVESAAATAAAITAAGGRVLKAPVAMGDLGTYAVVADPLGGAFALWQPRKPDAGAYHGVAGTFCWNELLTEDVPRSLAFYQAIAGFTDAPMDMGPMGTYHVLKRGDRQAAGVMKHPMAGTPSHWLHYVAVDDVDARTKRAAQLKGAVLVEPQDIPGIGRFSVVKDPQGAAFALFKGAPDSKM